MRGLRRNWKREREGTSGAPFATTRNVAAKQITQPATHGESETSALVPALEPRIELAGRLKECRGMFGFDGRARVPNGNARATTSVGDANARIELDREIDAAGIGELDRVVEQIQKNLLDAPLVAHDRRQLAGDVRRQ